MLYSNHQNESSEGGAKMSVKVIAVSHGRYSEGLVDSVQMLVGEQENLVYYGLFPEETVATLREKLQAELEATEEGMEVLFISDLFHGSPFNTIVDLMRDYDFYHLTGVNLPSAVLIMMNRYADMSAEEICRSVMKEAPDTVKYVNDMFDVDDDEDEEDE